jgi:hypothetical protein
MVNPLNMRSLFLAPTLACDGANITKARGSLKSQIAPRMTPVRVTPCGCPKVVALEQGRHRDLPLHTNSSPIGFVSHIWSRRSHWPGPNWVCLAESPRGHRSGGPELGLFGASGLSRPEATGLSPNPQSEVHNPQWEDWVCLYNAPRPPSRVPPGVAGHRLGAPLRAIGFVWQNCPA